MSVTMFECGFGDGFLLEEYVTRPLLVDFGVYFSPKVDKYKNVISKVGGKTNKDFLLTHFHRDHFSGMLFWKNNLKKFSKENHTFENVYIPAVNDVSVLRILLLGSLGKKHTLLDFLTVFCRLGWRGLQCVGTGDIIGELTVLWPDAEPTASGSIVDYAKKLWEQITRQNFAQSFSSLDADIEKLHTYIDEMKNPEFDKQDEVLVLIREIQKKLKEIESNQNLLDAMDAIFIEEIGNEKIYLNQYDHICNIVFHNTKNALKGKRNILFTGDVETKDMKNIMLRTNPELKLHEEYDIIKITHHGTEQQRQRPQPVGDDTLVGRHTHHCICHLVVMQGDSVRHRTRGTHGVHREGT